MSLATSRTIWKVFSNTTPAAESAYGVRRKVHIAKQELNRDIARLCEVISGSVIHDAAVPSSQRGAKELDITEAQTNNPQRDVIASALFRNLTVCVSIVSDAIGLETLSNPNWRTLINDLSAEGILKHFGLAASEASITAMAGAKQNHKAPRRRTLVLFTR